MTGNKAVKGPRKPLARFLAGLVMVAAYCLGTVALSGIALTGSSNVALAQRGRGGGGGGRGGGGGARGGGGRGGGARGAGPSRGRGGGRGVVRGGGRGRGFWRGGVWVPWVAPGPCHVRWSSRWVACF
jgi:hypothetical protein